MAAAARVARRLAGEVCPPRFEPHTSFSVNFIRFLSGLEDIQLLSERETDVVPPYYSIFMKEVQQTMTAENKTWFMLLQKGSNAGRSSLLGLLSRGSCAKGGSHLTLCDSDISRLSLTFIILRWSRCFVLCG